MSADEKKAILSRYSDERLAGAYRTYSEQADVYYDELISRGYTLSALPRPSLLYRTFVRTEEKRV